MEKRVIAIGYAIGYTPYQDTEYFNVQLNDNIYPINLMASYLWINALDSYTKLELIDKVVETLMNKGCEIGIDFTIDDVNTMYDTLVQTGLLLELDMHNLSSEDEFRKLANARFIKKGFGLGLTDNEIEIIHNSEHVKISSGQYFVWQLSSESRTLSDIIDVVINNIEGQSSSESYKNDIRTIVTQDTISLYIQDLIQIVGI